MMKSVVFSVIVFLASMACEARDTPISDGRLTSPLNANQQMITNLPSAFWEGHGGGSSVSTNAVSEIITNHVTSGYLCTVASAQAMTNDPTIVRGDYNGLYYDVHVNNAEASGFSSQAYADTSGNSIIGTYATKAENALKADAASVQTLATSVASNAENVAAWSTYWRGDRVRLSVTNYYGNTSGEPPRLRIEEFDHSTTNGNVISNFYRVVWDETTRQTNYMQRTDAKVDAISNTVMTAAFVQTANQLANKSPRAWQSVTSAGEDAPPNVVWHTAPSTVFAGGTEYAHVSVGEGSICVLVDRGAPVYTEGAEGQFRFSDESRQNYFGFDVRESYTIGCRTDGILVDVDNSLHMVSLTYDLTSETDPTVLHCTNLTESAWSEVAVTWDQNPPVGTKICYIDVGNHPHGFYKSQISYAGGAKFITNMMSDFTEGIAATNESGVSTATQLPVYPVITSTGVVWRVKWGSNQ